MDRNIINEEDASRLRGAWAYALRQRAEMGVTVDDDAGLRDATAGEPGGSGPPDSAAALTTPPNADDYWKRLIKYIPGETIGGYLLIEGALAASITNTSALRLALIALFLAGLVFTVLYLRNLAKVQRPSQLVMAGLAFSVYVFAVGGFWATLSWWSKGLTTIPLVVFGAAALFVPKTPVVPPAPTT